MKNLASAAGHYSLKLNTFWILGYRTSGYETGIPHYMEDGYVWCRLYGRIYLRMKRFGRNSNKTWRTK